MSTAHWVPSCSSTSPRQRATLNASLRAWPPYHPVLGLPRLGSHEGEKKAKSCLLKVSGLSTPFWGSGVGGVVVTWLRDERKAVQASGARVLPLAPSQASGSHPYQRNTTTRKEQTTTTGPTQTGQSRQTPGSSNFEIKGTAKLWEKNPLPKTQVLFSLLPLAA